MFGDPFSSSQSFLSGTKVPTKPLSIFGDLLTTANVAKAFATTIQQLELDATRSARASQHYQTIKDLIEKSIPNAKVRQIGGFRHGTKIRPATASALLSLLSPKSDEFTPIDVDALVVLGHAQSIVPAGGITSDSAMSFIHKTIARNGRYRVHDLTIDSPTVKLEYQDEFSLELVPAFTDGISVLAPARAWCQSYLVPNESGGWKCADYDLDAEWITFCNRECNGKLVPAVKLLKGFFRARGLPFGSFHTAIFCAHSLYDVRLELPRWDYRHIFSYLLSVLPSTLYVPISLPYSVSDPQILDTAEAISIEGKCRSFAAEALAIEKLGDTVQALKQWRELYGHPFPAADGF